MPVSLNSGEVYIIDDKVDIEREWALSFFLSGHIEDYHLLQDECGQYSGIITYQSLLWSTDLEMSVIREKLHVENLWWKAQEILGDDKSVDAVPVFDRDGEIQYFARYDRRIVDAWRKLSGLEEYVDWEMWKTFQCYTKRVHIRRINDVLFRLREWLISL